ncbi:MAG: glycosyltransferase [Chitinophagaceae bacterium]|nr:glycosyltransferase [Chitinophagaceae bacterium]
MKVTYYFRSQRKGVFSIEVLFARIIAALGNKVISQKIYVNLRNVFTTWWSVLFQSTDVHHITGDINYVALGLKGKKTILTVHDIGHYALTLQGWKKTVYKKLWLDWPLKKVACITTVSEFSRQQLITTFRLDPAKIKVVYNPFPTHYYRSDKEVLSPVPKILQIGSGTHKNLSRLMEAVKGISCELLLVRSYDEGIDCTLKEMGIACNWYFNLADEEIYALYVKSDLVFFASTYEGFGMPIVEAQATGRAVITSNLASMAEVGGEGVYLVDPYNVEEIRQAIVTLCTDHTYRRTLIEKGFQNRCRFESSVIAQQYLDLYHHVLKKNQ